MANFTPQEIEEMLREFFDVVGKRQYTGARYVPIFGRKNESSMEWDNSAPYEPLTIVLYQGNSYTSRTYVPTGVDIDDGYYWAETGNYNGQIELYRQDVINLENDWHNWKTDTESDIDTWKDGIEDGLTQWKNNTESDIDTWETTIQDRFILKNSVNYDIYVTPEFSTIITPTGYNMQSLTSDGTYLYMYGSNESDASALLVIDKTTFEIISTHYFANLGHGNSFSYNAQLDKLIVTSSNGKVHVIDPHTFNLEKTISSGVALSSFQISQNGNFACGNITGTNIMLYYNKVSSGIYTCAGYKSLDSTTRGLGNQFQDSCIYDNVIYLECGNSATAEQKCCIAAYTIGGSKLVNIFVDIKDIGEPEGVCCIGNTIYFFTKRSGNTYIGSFTLSHGGDFAKEVAGLTPYYLYSSITAAQYDSIVTAEKLYYRTVPISLPLVQLVSTNSFGIVCRVAGLNSDVGSAGVRAIIGATGSTYFLKENIYPNAALYMQWGSEGALDGFYRLSRITLTVDGTSVFNRYVHNYADTVTMVDDFLTALQTADLNAMSFNHFTTFNSPTILESLYAIDLNEAANVG